MSEKKDKVYCTFQAAPEHQFPGHPESPKRINTMTEWLQTPPYPEIHWLDDAPATEADAMLVHRKSLLQSIKEACAMGAHEFEPSPSYVTEESYRAALGAVGATLAVSKRIIADGTGRGFAIVRPPGHHAEPGASMGFCLLNNIAIAAADAVASGLGKAAIVDIDAHHGNGTQAAFWDTPEVGYLSTHEEKIFPGTGAITDAAHAKGRIINIPLPAFSSNSTYRQMMSQVIIPWLRAFQPEMIFVSAGFDAHFSDPLTTLSLDTKEYFQMTQRLVQAADEICGGRIMYVLEGGYDPLALKDNIQACLAAMSSRNHYEDHYGKSPGVNVAIGSLIAELRQRHHLQEK